MGVIKTVGRSGQILLWEKHAGQTIVRDEIPAGIWPIKHWNTISSTIRQVAPCQGRAETVLNWAV
jgi:hypothetical protein